MERPAETGPSRLPARLAAVGAYLTGVRGEITRVTWPSREELLKATRMIVILSLVLGVIIGLVDFLLQLILVRGVAALSGGTP